jgi:hypothetical protein
MLEAPVMRKKKPELIAVNIIPWDEPRGLYGIETVFDDGVIVREAWGSRLDATVAAAIRRKDIRVISPRRPTL